MHVTWIKKEIRKSTKVLWNWLQKQEIFSSNFVWDIQHHGFSDLLKYWHHSIQYGYHGSHLESRFFNFFSTDCIKLTFFCHRDIMELPFVKIMTSILQNDQNGGHFWNMDILICFPNRFSDQAEILYVISGHTKSSDLVQLWCHISQYGHHGGFKIECFFLFVSWTNCKIKLIFYFEYKLSG